MTVQVLSSLLFVALGAARMAAQDPHAAFNKPFPPFKVMDNIYFVGTEDLGTFLITTPAGHILINSDFETTVPQIRAAGSWASSSPTSKSCWAATPTETTWKATRWSRS